MKRSKSYFLVLSVLFCFLGWEESFSLYGQNSVLSNGNWAKMAWTQDGLYKLTGNDLTALGFGAGPWPSDSVGVYSQFTGVLPERNGMVRPTDLAAVPVRIVDGGDGFFHASDVLYFYAYGPHRWDWNTITHRHDHVTNPYSDTAFGFITVQKGGRRWSTAWAPPSAGARDVNRTLALSVHEKDQRNLIGSGREWFGEVFDYSLAHPVSIALPLLDAQSRVNVWFRAAVRASAPGTVFKITHNGQTIASGSVGTSSNIAGAEYAVSMLQNGIFQPGAGNLQIVMAEFDRSASPSATAFLDWVRVTADVPMGYQPGGLVIRNPLDTGNVLRYSVSNPPSNGWILEITRGVPQRQIPHSLVGGQWVFLGATDSLRTFYVGKPEDALSPVLKGGISPQNLHSQEPFDYVIVSATPFLPAAERLAQFHRTNSRLRVKVVTPEIIYNEFSSGAQDITAIRDYMRHLYKSATTPEDRPRYLLLFGDASYDYKDRVANKQNFVPIYESTASFSLYTSYCLDDYYGYLEDNEGYNQVYESLDIGIGRLPVNTLSEAEGIVTKIIGYVTDSTAFGPWRKRLVFVADDADLPWEATFSATQEQLSDRVSTQFPLFDVSKVYSDAYLQTSTSGSQSYPGGREVLLRSVEQGNLVTTYLGHGGEVGWSSENILQMRDVKAFSNGFKCPLFVTITCEFSRYDDPMRTSAGEHLLINPKGGAIALLSTTRVVSAAEGSLMNDSIFGQLFYRTDGKFRRFGDIVRQSKNSVRYKDKLRFALLGDPAVRLNVPEHTAVWDSLNGEAWEDQNDTVKALGRVVASGHMESLDGTFLSDFQGVAQVELLDKPIQRFTLLNDGQGQAIPFKIQENAAYRGKVSVRNGRFRVEFLVPLDIALNVGFGKLSLYAYNDTTDAAGQRSNVKMGGINPGAAADNTGPHVRVYIGDTLFQNGGIASENPVGLARIADPSGVNAVGNGIGHDILGALDGRWDQAVVLNGIYQTDVDAFTRGTVRWPYEGLAEGPHRFSVRAWDAYNNLGEGYIDFVVVKGDVLTLERLFVYPNPATEGPVTFGISHNQEGEELLVQLVVSSPSGQIVYTADWEGEAEGNRLEPIQWDLRSANGSVLPSGWYIFSVVVTHKATGIRAKAGERLVLLPNH